LSVCFGVSSCASRAKAGGEVQMSHFIALFVLGFKQFFNKRNFIALLVMSLLLLYAVNKGVDQYKDELSSSREFQKVEERGRTNVTNYTIYSFRGIRYLFVPSAAAVFFTDSPMMSELSGKIDSIVSIKLYNNIKGRGVFKGNNKGFLRFSGLILLMGTLFVLFTGYESMYRKEYLKFLCGSFSHLKVFLAIMLSRFILIILTLLLMFALAVGLLGVRGVELSATDFKGLWIYLGMSLLVLLIFLVIGGIIGMIRSTAINITLLLAVWIISVFIIPGLFDSVIEERSDNIFSSYKADLNKLQKITIFENRVEKKYGKFDRRNIALEREIVEDYWKNDRPKIERDEEKLKGEISEVIDRYKRLSILFPTTFYTLTALEVSGRGYENYLDFYDYVQKSQRRFARFWIDRVYYNDLQQVVSFIKGDEIIFHGGSRVPSNYIPGLILNLLYAVALLVGSYLRFKKWLYTPMDKKTFNEKDRDIQLRKGRINVLYSHRSGLRDQMYVLFSGKSSNRKSPTPSLHVTLEGKAVSETSANRGFVYICHPSAIPGDIKLVDLVSFLTRANGVSATEKAIILRNLPAGHPRGQRFNRLEPHEQADVLLSALPYVKGNIYLVDQVGKDMPLSILVKLKDQLQTLAKTGALVIYLTHDKRVEALPTQPEREVLDLPDWFEAVEAHRFLLEEETGKWRTATKPGR
jgi:hypothetical protein